MDVHCVGKTAHQTHNYTEFIGAPAETSGLVLGVRRNNRIATNYTHPSTNDISACTRENYMTSAANHNAIKHGDATTCQCHCHPGPHAVHRGQ